MPNCFQLTRKGFTEPVILAELDREICQNCEIPFHEKYWAGGWYDFVGFGLAIGKTWDELVDIAVKYEDWLSVRIIAYLRENYTTDAWYETKR